MTKAKNSTSPRPNKDVYLTPDERAALLAEHNNRCDTCGRDGPRLAAHHTDYSEKPHVILCPACHRSLHGFRKAYKEIGLLGRVVRHLKSVLEQDLVP